MINGVHFSDDVFSYGFHDEAPHFQVKNGETYGFPYRAMLVKNMENLFAVGMMVTSDHHVHMSTRNTVSQRSGRLPERWHCVKLKKDNVRDLPYKELYATLKADNVWFDQDRQ